MQARFTRDSDFLQERDFGAKISATFEFLGAHWRPLGKCVLYFALPLSLLLGVGLGLITNGIWNVAGLAKSNPRAASVASDFGASYFSGFGLAFVGGLLAFVMLLSTVYGYVRVILLSGGAATPPTPAQVWVEIKARLGRMVLAFVLLGALYGAVMVLFVGLIGTVGKSMGGVFAVMLLMLALMALLFYAGVPLALYFPAMWMEDLGVFAALNRCYALVRRHWWATLGLMLVAGLIQGVLAFLFVLPQYAVMAGKMLQIPGLNSDALGIAAQCLYAGGIIFTYCVSLLAALFQYFNLVEQKEGHGLRALVDSLGTGVAPAVHGTTYRPDDDGEY